jgi:5'-nucleotidase (lipoprotein e(P4) family)
MDCTHRGWQNVILAGHADLPGTESLPMTRLPALALTLALLTACAAPAPRQSALPAPAAPASAENFELDNLNGVVWARTAAEAEALHRQSYAMARRALEMALADPSWTAATEQSGDFSRLPPAVIVDVDETVLDTSDYMVERFRNGRPFDKVDWNRYVQRENATPIPGALDFLKYAASKGVTVFYVSNRSVADAAAGVADEVEPSRRNLAKFGFPNTDSTKTFLFRDKPRGWQEKSPRRAEVAKTHRILMLVGDNLYDFVDIEQADRDKRALAVQKHLAWLGTRWIVIANPMYGSWEQVVAGYDTGAAGRKARLEAVGVPGEVADLIADGGFER